MKQITEYYYNFAENKYLNEGLLDWFKAFFKKVFKSQQSRLNGNNVEMYKVNTKNIKFAKQPVKFSEVDNDTLNEWKHDKLGYVVATNIINNQKKLLVDINNNPIDPLVYTFFSPDEDGKRTYSVALLMVDNNSTYIENYKHIVDIESNLIVDNPTEVNETVLKQYIDICKKENSNIKGFTAKNLHPKLKGNLNKLKFKTSQENKEILIYNI